jgi:hypothetical protein
MIVGPQATSPVRRRALDSEWAMVAAYAVATISIYAATGTRLSLGTAGRAVAIVPVLLAVFLVYRYWRPVPVLADLVGGILKLFAILLLGLLITFPLASVGAGFPYRDAPLLGADAVIGFDWGAYTSFVARHGWLRMALHAAYVSMQPQYFVAAAALAVARRSKRLHGLVLATGIALAATLAIFVFMPALSHPGGGWVAPLDYMRGPGDHAISFDDLNGIVAFRSFHAASACLFIWAFWAIPYLRWPALALNLLLIAATPVDGLHYAVDTVAGAALAIAVLVLVGRDREAAR